MIGYINSVNDKEWKPCTKEKFFEIIDSDIVAKRIIEVRGTSNKAGKRKLPAFIFGGELVQEAYQNYVDECRKTGVTKLKGSRSEQFLQPTGLFMMDFDRDTDMALQLFDKFKQAMCDNNIPLKGFLAAAHRTAGGLGLRLVLKRRSGISIWDDQQWIATMMQESIDEKCKDMSRTSFAVPRQDFFFIDEELLFGEGRKTEELLNTSHDKEEPREGELPMSSPAESETLPAVDAKKASCNKAMDYSMASASSNEAANAAFEQDYDGIPYPLLVEALAEQLGGVPAHGSRNNFIFSMACHLRYVCNDSPEWIKQVLPTYGEDTDRAYRTMESACNRAQSRFMPQVVQRAISIARSRMQVQTTLNLGGGMDNTPPPMPPIELLPPLIRLLTSKVPNLYKPCVSHAVFPALGTHLGNVYFRYIDNVLRQPTFMCVLMAKMSVGKSCVNKPIDCILADIEGRDQESRRREREWSEETCRKGANKEKPKRPDNLCIQLVQSDMTNAAFVRRLEEAHGNFIYTRLDEVELLDQLKTSSKGQQVSQIIRLAFDNGWYGQERVGTQSVTARVRVKWNWNASSTIQNGQHYFRNSLADGTLSRLNFCTILTERGAEIPVIGTYDDTFAEELKPYIDNLNAAEGIISCQEAEILAKQLLQENADVANLSDDEAYEALSYRANVIAYLKAMTLYVAQGCQWDEKIEHFVRWSERYDLWCKMKFFGEQMQEQMGKEQLNMMRGPKNLLELLPDRFTQDDVTEVRRKAGKCGQGQDMLRMWIKRGYAEKDETTGEYIKTMAYRKTHSSLKKERTTNSRTVKNMPIS